MCLPGVTGGRAGPPLRFHCDAPMEDRTLKAWDLVIVGGSAAGFQAAISARTQKQIKKALVIRKEPRAVVPCGIPYIVGTLGSIEKNLLPDKILGDTELMIDEVTSLSGRTPIISTNFTKPSKAPKTCSSLAGASSELSSPTNAER